MAWCRFYLLIGCIASFTLAHGAADAVAQEPTEIYVARNHYLQTRGLRLIDLFAGATVRYNVKYIVPAGTYVGQAEPRELVRTVDADCTRRMRFEHTGQLQQSAEWKSVYDGTPHGNEVAIACRLAEKNPTSLDVVSAVAEPQPQGVESQLISDGAWMTVGGDGEREIDVNSIVVGGGAASYRARQFRRYILRVRLDCASRTRRDTLFTEFEKPAYPFTTYSPATVDESEFACRYAAAVQ